MSYQDDLKLHLSSYKKSVLGVSVQGEFIHQGKVILYDHILPKVDTDLNLLPIARSLEGSFRKSRHRYFHHLNSSQAFAFNLFLPFFTHGSLIF
ncbi:hypothetical protein [Armatimonas sp.]|uniref:PGN_0703 family putative restriction endonuclease n=1 Tax=Armatimonas sp. TaxID=1872638 RepID=UPI00286CA066|nr:hypothetical protein [Armatimonas sp.]